MEFKIGDKVKVTLNLEYLKNKIWIIKDIGYVYWGLEKKQKFYQIESKDLSIFNTREEYLTKVENDSD